MSNSWKGDTAIKGCFADFDSSSNTLEYCNNPYIHFKTKQIYFCDENNDGDHDSGEKKGTFSSPEVNCGWTPYDSFQKTRQYEVCGKDDGETNPDPTPQTTTVNENVWTCPATKALSLRHKPGNLEAGFGLAATGYTNLDSLSYVSQDNVSFYMMASIPACVNRIPMLRLDVRLKNSTGETVSQKVGIYAKHMNLYYGPGGDNSGTLKQVQLPAQDAFKKQYGIRAELKSYRMWAWRQRFAEAVTNQVDRQNLELPKNVDVSEIAQRNSNEHGVPVSGASVGELWLSSDFLLGAKAEDPGGSTRTFIRNVNSTCVQDVRKIDEINVDTIDAFRTYVQNNPDQAENILGKETGDNYCSIGTNETLTKIWNIDDTGATRKNYSVLTATATTKVLDNKTTTFTAGINVTRLDIAYVNDSQSFVDHFNANTSEATAQLVAHKLQFETGKDMGDHSIVSVSDVTAETTYNVSFSVTTTHWTKASTFAGLDLDTIYDRMNHTMINSDLTPKDVLKPTARFEDKWIRSVESISATDTYTVEMELNTSENVGGYLASITVGTRVEESAKTSWNWRALQGVSMTDLARCLYNWENCLANERNLPGKSWNAHEVYDTGYGPWKGSFTFQWSKQAAQNKIQELQQIIDDTSQYDRQITTTFDKYFDGARGVQSVSTQSGELNSITVYRRCGTRDSWLSSSGSYPERQFMCKNGTETVYRCKWSPSSSMPDYVSRSPEGTVKKFQGDYYVCKQTSPAQWTLDTKPPSVSCDNCIMPSPAERGATVTISPEVTDTGAGVESVTVCRDQNCQQILCQGSPCTYTSDETMTSEVWVRAEDRQGNVQRKQIGDISFKVGLGGYCTSDSQCISNSCRNNECRLKESPPIINIQ
ncbi:MAG: hypothetical protein SVU32_00085 [Candidatus Nanohaloarchaea archaeon]|nr:hypothetical protein [Candidatus Nanohaloarchaea archaeon]